MKVFVYSKKTSKKLAEINHVESVKDRNKGSILISTDSGERFSFNTKDVKTTIYQN